MNTSFKTLATLALSATLLTAFSSCSKDTPRPKAPVDQRNDKGHEDPEIITFTLTEATLKAGKSWGEELTMDDVTRTSNVQRLQYDYRSLEHDHDHDHDADHDHGDESEISTLKPTTGAGFTDRFQVKSQVTSPQTVYVLEIHYQDAQGNSMDDQLTSEDQIDRHQNIFRQLENLDAFTTGRYSYVRDQLQLNFDYLYQDRVTRQPAGAASYVDNGPIGLRGLIVFKRPVADMQVLATLLHINSGKYLTPVTSTTSQRWKNATPFYINRANGAQMDLNSWLPFRVD